MRTSFLQVAFFVSIFMMTNVLFSVDLMAVVKTFNTNSGSWGTSGNWTPSGVPASGDDVVFPSTVTSVTNVPNASINSVTIEGTSGTIAFTTSSSGNRLTITSSFSLLAGRTMTIGNGNRMNMTFGSNCVATIAGTLNIYSGGTTRDITNDGDLTITSSGLIIEGEDPARFTLSAGATLRIGSTAGITSSGGTGNVRTSTRQFNTGAYYVYNGVAAQNTGNGLPATVAGLKFDNSAGAVTLNSARTITGSFVITSGSVANLGTFTHNTFVLILGGSPQITGSWGSTSSSATNQNNTFFALSTGIVNVSNVITTNSTGANTFIVPEGVTGFTVEAYGGGGRGGSRTSGNDNTGFGGGGGGGYSSKVYTGVTPLTSYNYFVGSGSTSNSNNGQDSWFETNAILLARGGTTVPNHNTNGGNGAALGIGDITRTGGNGANGGSSTPGGGGGSSAGTDNNGTNATGQSGAVAPTGGGNGGNGGSSGSSNSAGIAGTTPGGGGGGAYRASSGGDVNGGNGANGRVIITINTSPPCDEPDVPTLLASETTICAGEDVTIEITGGDLNDATDWEWYTGSCGGTSAGSGTSIMVSPGTTTTYYVRGEGGCTGDCAQITITVNSLPNAMISGNLELCAGDDTELTASGGVSYIWSTTETTAAITVSSANTYSVTVEDANGCTATTSAVVTVNSLPTADINGTTTDCGSVTLTASGGTSYSWSGGLSPNNAENTFTSTDTYTVTVTDANGCTDTESATVTVHTLPAANITGNDEICDGQSTELTASGGVSYEWSNAETTSTIEVSPNTTTTYYVTVTSAENCTSTDEIEVTVEGTAGFEGHFDPSNWVLENDEADGDVDVSDAPCSITLTGGDDDSGDPGVTDYTICVGEGTWEFDWAFTAPGSGSGTIVWHTSDMQTDQGSSGNTQTVDAPSNLQAGDLIIVTLHFRRTVTLTGLDGFTLIRNETSGSAGDSRASVVALYKIATGLETSFSFTTTGNGTSNSTWRASANRITGHDPSNPIGNQNGNNSGSSEVDNITVTGINTTIENSMLVGAIAIRNNETINIPSGMTLVHSYSASSLGARTSTQTIASIGGTGNKSWTGWDDEEAAALLFIINPGIGSDDAAYYIINGTETLLSDQDGSGSESVSVENGDIVGFRIRTSTNTGGAGVLTISNFSAPVGAGGEAGEISGSDELCIGEIEIYTSDGDSGGSWTSDDEDVVTIDESTGEVTAVGSGTTTIYYSLSGECGNAQSSFEITVNPLPTPICTLSLIKICVDDLPYDLTQNVNPSGGTFSGDGVNGDEFSNSIGGPYLITYTVTSMEDCTGTCTFNIEVLPLPEITCPSNITLSADPDECSREDVVYNAPVIGDDPDITYEFTGATNGDGNGTGSNSTFNVGVTTVTIYVDDTCDNTSCSFTITIEDDQAPTITCPSNQNVNLSSECKVVLPNLVGLTSAGDNCSGHTITQSPLAFSAHDSEHNQTHVVVMTVTDASDNSTFCNVVLTAKDVTNPQITTCPSAANVNLNSSCQLIVTNLVAQTTATDNCTVTVSQSPLSGEALTSSHNQVHVITVTATDAAGNASACTVSLTAKDVTNPTISCPSDMNVDLDENCELEVPSLTGDATANDNCSGYEVTQLPVATDLLASSHNNTHEITITVTDGAGLTSACVVVLTGIDVTNPTITCPANTTVALDADCEFATPNLTGGATPADNCSDYNVTQYPVATTTMESNHNGTHQVTITVTDDAGLTSACVVTLTAIDVTNPTIIECPIDRDVELNQDQKLVVPNLIGDVDAEDNCNVASITQNPTAGSELPSSNDQTHDITLTVTDDAGNTTQCVVTLTGKFDAELSVICPDDITVQLDECNCDAIVTYDDAEVTSDLSYEVEYSHPSGSTFPVGATVVTVEVTDASNNMTDCMFTITVEDNERMEVSGNGAEIENGSTSPSATNHTKFGSVALNGTVTRTYTIRNVGCSDLILTGTPEVEIGGADPSYFEVTVQPSPTDLESCDEVTFSIKYTGSAYGLHTATVSIANNSTGQNPFTFAISGATSQMLMQVRGNSVPIPDGDVTPAPGDWTDFGVVNYLGNRSRTFYVHNIGAGSLVLSGSPRVQLSGPGADKFTVTLQPASPISGGQNKGFSIRFDGTAIGDFYATVSIENNDLGANPYTFTIRGTVLPPDMYVTGNNITIENGDDTPQTADFTDFGTRNVGSTTTFSYYVRNQAGGGLLYLHGVPRAQISGPGAGMFLIASQPVASINPGGNSLLRISFKPTTIGTYTATITIPNNDPNKDPYTFDVRGTTPGAMPFWGGDTDMPVSIIEESLSVFPNPANDQIFIDAPYRHDPYTLEIMSIEGKVIHNMETQGGRVELNIRTWLPGMYYIRAVGVELDPVRFIRSE